MSVYDPLRLAGEQFDARPRMTETERLAAVAYDAAHLAALRIRAAELLGDLGDLLADLS